MSLATPRMFSQFLSHLQMSENPHYFMPWRRAVKLSVEIFNSFFVVLSHSNSFFWGIDFDSVISIIFFFSFFCIQEGTSFFRFFLFNLSSQVLFSSSFLLINVVYGHFAHYGHFDRHDRLRTSVYQVRWQRQREKQHHLSTMWCVSELDFMNISLRAKSEMNYLQNSSQLRLLRKCTFASLMSCDVKLTNVA
jgi:hypothetical protein